MATATRPARFAPLLRRISASPVTRIAPFTASQTFRSATPNFSQTCLPLRRFAHTIPQPPTPTSTSTSTSTSDGENGQSEASPEKPPRSRVQQQPHYQLTFTCSPCSTKSTHNISKQGYHHGSVLVTCPECRNRHVISDHLGIFGDRKMTIEDIMREKGQLVKKGTLGEDGDIEFWQDNVPGSKQDAELEGEGKSSP